jgi:uncharacterized protein (TIGR04255 family)
MNWEPAHADHAIDRVVATFSFASPFDPNTFDELVVGTRRAAASHQLTNRLDQQDPIEIGPGSVGIVQVPPFFRRRVVFHRTEAPNLVLDEIAIGQQRIAFATSRYRRWEHFKQIIVDTLSSLERVAPISTVVKAIKLEYYDRFQALLADADLYEVIDKSSPYLSPILQGKTAALHVHTGWFDYEPEHLRRLTNLNIDANDAMTTPEGSKTVTILSLGQLEALGEGMLREPLTRVDQLHDYLKNLIAETITNEAAARIGLAK